jgi:hypothetical protein
MRHGQDYGILAQSGLRIEYREGGGGRALTKMALEDGTVLFDGKTVLVDRPVKLVTTDFLLRRKSGADVLKKARKRDDVGVLRERLEAALRAKPPLPRLLRGDTDGRFKRVP